MHDPQPVMKPEGAPSPAHDPWAQQGAAQAAQNGRPAPTGDLSGFEKIAAQRRQRAAENQPITIPFGAGTIRIHSTMPADFAVGLMEAQADPGRAVQALRAAVWNEDHPRLEAVLKMSPDNPEAIDGAYLLDLVLELGRFYSAVPLGV